MTEPVAAAPNDLQVVLNTVLEMLVGLVLVYFGYLFGKLTEKKKQRDELNTKILAELFMLRFEYHTFRDYYKVENLQEQEKFREKIMFRKLTISDLLRLHNDKNEIERLLKCLFQETKYSMNDRIKEIEKLVEDFAEKVNKKHVKVWKEIADYNDKNYEFRIDGYKKIP